MNVACVNWVKTGKQRFLIFRVRLEVNTGPDKQPMYAILSQYSTAHYKIELFSDSGKLKVCPYFTMCALFKSAVHSSEPGETPSYSAVNVFVYAIFERYTNDNR